MNREKPSQIAFHSLRFRAIFCSGIILALTVNVATFASASQLAQTLGAKKTPKRRCPDKPFEPGCKLPFANAITRDIDHHCPRTGSCTSGRNTRVQNYIKNNFCAVPPAVEIGIASLDQLQNAVDDLVAKHQIAYGKNYSPPTVEDRAKLKSLQTVDVNNQSVTLGEGALVVFQGVVLDAKHDYSFPLTFSGEGVNCIDPTLPWNDIHITLGETPTTAECDSVSAKISPHFRPAAWDRFDSNPVTAPFVIEPLPVKHLTVRITGQLFFDGSHLAKPCQAPRRRTSWEIHPVYAIEVLDSAHGKFIKFEEWAKDK